MGRKRSRSRDRSGNSGVSRRAVLGLVLAGGAGLAGVQQTGAFSSVTGDRGFDVQTAEDGEALLGITRNEGEKEEKEDIDVESGEEATLFTITNRFNSELTIDSVNLVAAPSDLSIEGLSGTDMPLSPGGKHDITGKISCDSEVSSTVTVKINASTDSESVELTRNSRKIKCQTAGDGCLTDLNIEKEDETIPCIDVSINGNKDSSISLDNVTVTGDVNIVINGGGNAEIEIEIEESNIEGDLNISINGNGNREIEIELKHNTVEGNRSVDGEDDDDDDDDSDDD